MFSDNAKTFRKAGELLREKVLWKFIPARSPHFGGFYERLIASVKSSLRKAIGRASLAHDDFLTLIHEVEGVLNRRPLSYVAEDPSSPVPLRPIDFLQPSFPESVPDEPEASDLRRLLGKSRILLQSFWNRWRVQYLNELRHWRRRKPKDSLVPAPGHVVLIHNESTKNRCFFPLGVITSVVRGSDGQIRSAYVLSGGKLMRRSVHLLYPLEVPDHRMVPIPPVDPTKKSVEPEVEHAKEGPSRDPRTVPSTPEVVTRSGRVSKPVRRH
jgi:hypothetical protein